MRNLTENEMASVYGGINFEAWTDGYNCLQCRDKAGTWIGIQLLADAFFGSIPIVSLIATTLAEKLTGDPLEKAKYYCPLCYNDVFGE
jgi:bacteriocin-like protein